jgi:hypothetical protein
VAGFGSSIPSFWPTVSNKRIKKTENIPKKNQERPIAGDKSTIGEKGLNTG